MQRHLILAWVKGDADTSGIESIDRIEYIAWGMAVSIIVV